MHSLLYTESILKCDWISEIYSGSWFLDPAVSVTDSTGFYVRFSAVGPATYHTPPAAPTWGQFRRPSRIFSPLLTLTPISNISQKHRVCWQRDHYCVAFFVSPLIADTIFPLPPKVEGKKDHTPIPICIPTPALLLLLSSLSHHHVTKWASAT